MGNMNRETKFRTQQKQVTFIRQRVMSAGRSFNSPFKGQYDKQDEFPQGKYVYYCALVVEAALELNPAIRPLYVEAVSALNCLETMKFEADIWKQNNSDSIPLVKMDAANIFGNDYRESQGFKHYQDCVSTFILKGFNHDPREPKITGDKGTYLALAISIGTAAESKGTTFKELDAIRMKDNYRVMQNDTNHITNRPDREKRKRISAIKQQYDLHLVHEEGLYELAKLWYFAYVIKDNLTVASQLGDYHGVNIPTFSNPGTAHNKLRDFTAAMNSTI